MYEGYSKGNVFYFIKLAYDIRGRISGMAVDAQNTCQKHIISFCFVSDSLAKWYDIKMHSKQRYTTELIYAKKVIKKET